MTARYLGAHTIDTGGIHMAVRRAARAGMRALQLFTAIPKYYGDRVSIRPERVARFREALAATEIEPRHVIAHAAYVLNAASAEEEKWTRARNGLAKELERATALGIGAICFHPGAATDGNRDAGVERVSRAIVHALQNVTGDTRVLVENTAGAGNTLGLTAEEIAAILVGVPDPLRRRTGYGLDTCHLFAAGHDIAESREALTAVLDAFEAVTGEPPSFFHLNDSQFPLGANRDRHALIGEGQIGAEAFRWLLHDRRTESVPLILETPQEGGIGEDDDTPDPLDVRMMQLLGGLVVTG